MAIPTFSSAEAVPPLIRDFTQHAIEMELRKVGVTNVISGRNEVTVRELGSMADRMAVSFCRYVLTHTPLTSTVSWPDGPWQQIRTYFPKFVLRRWPVRYKQLRVRVDVLFPKANVVVPPSSGSTVRFNRTPDLTQAGTFKYPDSVGPGTIHITRSQRTTYYRDSLWDDYDGTRD